MEFKKIKKELVYFYNQKRRYFVNVPPFSGYNFPLPEAKIEEDCVEKEYRADVIFDVDPDSFIKTNIFAPMLLHTRYPEDNNDKRREYTVKVNPYYYRRPVDLKGLLLFPLLHEMIHIKEGVLGSNNLSFDHKDFPNFDFIRARKLFDELKSRGDDKFREQFEKDGVNCFILCDFLSQELLKNGTFKNLLIGERKVDFQLNWLTEHLYWFNREEY